ncbi:MAG: hypothetical protein Kow0092_14660 [Deferrisomatales bacterium]
MEAASIQSTPPSGPSAPTPQVAPRTLADFDQFLSLFVAQLRNQDPLNPVQGEEFLAQSAQFSSVEQLVKLTDLMEQMASQSGTTTAATAAALIGREVDAVVSDGEGAEVAVSGRVVEVTHGPSGALTLGLEDGTQVAYGAVRKISGSS